MTVTNLTCIECPIGCEIEVRVEDEGICIVGNNCPRGKAYARDEVTCPKRVVTSTVRAQDGAMIPVKTDKPILKSEIFRVMDILRGYVCAIPVKIGDVLIENISGDAHLIATGNYDSINRS